MNFFPMGSTTATFAAFLSLASFLLEAMDNIVSKGNTLLRLPVA